MELSTTTPAAQARDAALSAVLDASQSWRSAAQAGIVEAELPETFTGEDIRRELGPRIGQPNNPNAWGGLVMGFVRAGLIEPTGEWRPMREAKSHARKTQVYRRPDDVKTAYQAIIERSTQEHKAREAKQAAKAPPSEAIRAALEEARRAEAEIEAKQQAARLAPKPPKQGSLFG